ncbi:MAG: FAD-dependent monooxygenase [Rhizobiaceae bacterium]|nr:FAD-dependent monooxygenase [Rhizobiaceae bacterium]
MKPRLLIVGAGPVGLTLAVEMARYGVPLRIIDKAPARTDKSKAVAVWPRTLELFEGAEVADRLVAAGVKVKAANIGNGRERIAHIRLDGLDTRYQFALMIPQSETERILETRLAELGVTVERSVELTGFRDEGNAVEAEVRHADGTAQTVLIDWIAGCDGAHSVVRHTIGREFRGETVDDHFLLADIRLSSSPMPADELMIWWHQEGIVAFFPLPGDRIRLIASTEPPADPNSSPTLDEVQKILDRRGPGGMTAEDPVWMARFRINERKVEDYRAGRAFLAGDAAHIHSPAGGQGMNTGMQDAFNLAWKLALVCQGACREQLLNSYSAERSRIAAEVIAASGKATRLAMLKNPVAQAVRNFVASHMLGLSPVQHAASEMLSELSIGYPDSKLTGRHAHGLKGPLPGNRMPPKDDSASGHHPRFALFAAEADTAVLAAFPELLEDRLRAPLDANGIWLVRPDGYVALTAKSDDWPLVYDYLSRLKADGSPAGV